MFDASGNSPDLGGPRLRALVPLVVNGLEGGT
jgi:hypothetical protein